MPPLPVTTTPHPQLVSTGGLGGGGRGGAWRCTRLLLEGRLLPPLGLHVPGPNRRLQGGLDELPPAPAEGVRYQSQTPAAQKASGLVL